MADDQETTGQDGNGSRSRRILTDIAPHTWEHPADKAALQALRRIPVFDEVLRKLFAFFGEKPFRLAYQASAVRVSENQFPDVYRVYKQALKTMDAPDEWPLFVRQAPDVNAMALGMDNPFIVVNSETVQLLQDDELEFILGHEIGHIMSDHVLYRSMTELLLGLANIGFPIVGIAARVILVSLLEWQRKSELSCDRAGLLAVQDVELVLRTMLKMAGGAEDNDDTQIQEYIAQAEEYREGGDIADQIFKVLILIGQTHPFYALRVGELRDWIESGDYDRIVRGEYPRRGEPDPAYAEDLKSAANAYAEDAKDFFDNMADAAKRAGSDILNTIRRQ